MAASRRRAFHESVRSYRDELNRVFSSTLTQKPLISTLADPRRDIYEIGFRDHGVASTASIRSRFGLIRLFISQTYDPTPDDDEGPPIRLLSYRYTIGSSDTREATFRWEYVSRVLDPDAHWCRYHIQGPLPTGFGDPPGPPMNDFHLPTGPVPIEEIIRFCIVDLGVGEMSDDVDARLRESYARSRTLVVAE